MLSQLPDYREWKAKQQHEWGHQRMLKKLILAAVFLVAFGASVAIAWRYLPQSMDLGSTHNQWSQERSAQSSRVYYRNCAAAWAAGVAPIHAGQPGYRIGLDADLDGVACEPLPLRRR